MLRNPIKMISTEATPAEERLKQAMTSQDHPTYFLRVILKLILGTFLGAMTGAFIGQETESGFVRGAAIGVTSGAVFTIEVFESSLHLWRTDESGIGCLMYLVLNLIQGLNTLDEKLKPSGW